MTLALLTLQLTMIIIILACYEITVSGTLDHPLMEGKYTVTAEHGCGGKPSWTHESGQYFIYEQDVHAANVEDTWMLSGYYCSSRVSKFFPWFRTSTVTSFLVFL